MLHRGNYLPLIVLLALAAILAWSCTQPVDVTTPVASTTLTLSPERLPTLPTGMIYQLWVASSSDTISLGQFFYNHDSLKFYDSTGVERSNKFVFGGDLLLKSGGNFVYKSVLVSVERYPNHGVGVGSIILLDTVANPSDNPIDLVFPQSDSLWSATANFSVQGVSDRNGAAGIGKGLWFTNFSVTDTTFVDTIGVTIDSSTTSRLRDTTSDYACHVISVAVETTYVTFGPDTLVFGADSIRHIGTVVTYEYCHPTPPYNPTALIPTWTYGSSQSVQLNLFSQPKDPTWGLPDLTKYGWKYKGWILSTTLPVSPARHFSPPVWPYKGGSYNFIPGDNGGFITTGTFSTIDKPGDNGNTYGFPKPASSMFPVVPLFPGADFLNNDSLNAKLGIPSIQLIQGSGYAGSVLITLEPIFALNDTTNFPLIVMNKPMPTSPSRFNSNDLFNRTSHVRGDLYGFPAINVEIDRK